METKVLKLDKLKQEAEKRREKIKSECIAKTNAESCAFQIYNKDQ
jgi:hypothetical protein